MISHKYEVYSSSICNAGELYEGLENTYEKLCSSVIRCSSSLLEHLDRLSSKNY